MGLYPRDWGGRVSLALDAYYDESGSHDGSHLNVLAGFAARPQQWEAFEREWMKSCGSTGLLTFGQSICFIGSASIKVGKISRSPSFGLT